MKEQYGLSINSLTLKEQLLKAFESGSGKCASELKRILSLYDKHNKPCTVTLTEVLRAVAAQPEVYSKKLFEWNFGRFFANYMTFINTMLSHDMKDKIAIDAAMAKAVSTLSYEGLDWAGELKTNYGATMDPAKLKEVINELVDKQELFILDRILPLFARDQDAKAANIMILEKLASKPNQYYSWLRQDVQTVCKKRLESSCCWSQKAVDALIKRAIEDDHFRWACELNSKYDAHLDSEMFLYQNFERGRLFKKT